MRKERKAMSAEDNKRLVRRMVDEVNGGNLDVFDEVLAVDFVDHAPPRGVPPTREGFKQFQAMLLAGLPDNKATTEDLIAEGDKVVWRWSGLGHHTGVLMGLPPTGRPIRATGIEIFRVANGRFVEHWSEWSQMAMMQQLGLVPAPQGAPAI
jgi:predicted ester cyclase